MNTASSLLDYLPPIFAEDAFLGRFLLAFESILLKRPPDEGVQSDKGLEEAIAGIHNYFDAQDTPEEFLEWLSTWVAFSLRADWKPEHKREFLTQAVSLYQRRGTMRYLLDVIEIYSTLYTGKKPEKIDEGRDDLFMVGRAKIGNDTRFGIAPPHHFTVTVEMPEGADNDEINRRRNVLDTLIETHKPAHTTFRLILLHEPIQIGVRSTVGVDTLLGTLSKGN